MYINKILKFKKLNFNFCKIFFLSPFFFFNSFEKSFFFDSISFMYTYIYQIFFKNDNINVILIIRDSLIFFENSYIKYQNYNLFWFIILYIGIFLSLNIIFSNNAINSLLFLIVIYVYSSILLILFNLEFFGLLYTIIYVGAIAVLFLFIIMMLKFERSFNSINIKNYNWIYHIIIFIFFLFFYLIFYNNYIYYIKYFNNFTFSRIIPTWTKEHTALLNYDFLLLKIFKLKYWIDDLYDLSIIFYTEYYYIFILAGLILLISIVAPIILTFRERLHVKFQNASNQLSVKKNSIIYFKDL